MDSSDLQRYIKEHQIEAEIIHLPVQTLTVAAAAEALKVREEQIIKSILFLADDRPVLVVANGLARIHRKRLADTLQLSRRRVKMAAAEQVLQLTGFKIGSVPPFGHQSRIGAIIDRGVLAQKSVYGGGGESNALMHLTTKELQRVMQAEEVDVTEDQ